MSKHIYIAIEGPIGVGKTTLARMLRQSLDTQLLLEVFEENPFLRDFYKDRERFAFQTEVFFLISRYHQQRVIPDLLGKGGLTSDYLFAKSRLFAHLNLRGDEWDLYERTHGALAEHIPLPDLIVYLRASVDVLMARIAHRDRPYERVMERSYIAALSAAYEQFFAGYDETPVIAVDTDELDIVARPADYSRLEEQVLDALQGVVYQPALGIRNTTH
ncbi:MAG: deoxynucleoside kinase [Chloroflexi bacterium]|nr:deoxynucleoside kinase [Chloroflexota bacterium]